MTIFSSRPIRAHSAWLLVSVAFAIQPSIASAATPTPVPTTQARSAQPAPIIIMGRPNAIAPLSGTFVDQETASAQATADAHFFSRCVKPADNVSLHELIDGQPNREIRSAALKRIKTSYLACYPGHVNQASLGGIGQGDCNPRLAGNSGGTICQSFFDRGALVEKVLQDNAPTLTFTTTELLTPGVLARFHAREDQFNTTRSKGEIIYSELASCFVAVHPEIAFDYLKTVPNSAREARLRKTLIGSAPACIHGAKTIAVAPAQFRVFAADAVYSWAVALRGSDTLIASNGNATAG